MAKESEKKTEKVKKGSRYACAVCGLAVTIDTVCGCAEVCDIICCDRQMEKKK